MKHTLALVALVTLTAGALPATGRAQCTVDQVIEGCDIAFPETSFFGSPFRGWCYLLGLTNCALN